MKHDHEFGDDSPDCQACQVANDPIDEIRHDRDKDRREFLMAMKGVALREFSRELGVEPHPEGEGPIELIERVLQEEAAQIHAGRKEAARFTVTVDQEELMTAQQLRPVVRYWTMDGPGRISKTAEWVMSTAIPEWAEHFLAKNADYGDQHAIIGLGPAAEFVGMWRKMFKLKKAIWEGAELNGEKAPEMLDDLIATCFLIKHLIALDEGTAEPITQLGE